MNLFSFIDKYGEFTFDEVAFNEIDNVILSMMSYLNLEGIVSRNSFKPKLLSEVAEEFFKKNPRKEDNFRAIKNAIKIFKNIKDTKRYKDLLLYNYIYETSGNNQFGALTIELNKNQVYVSFEGTDHLIGGWKEDFMLTYMFPVLSQKKAISYLNKNFFFSRKQIILGGHSKGGNLALVAGMYASIFVKDKIIAIYNNDGPGLLTKEFESKKYKKIISKLIWIVPNYSIVGLLLNHSPDFEVIRSFKKSIYSHDPLTWVVDDLKFERTNVSTFTKKVDEKLLEWVNKYSVSQKRKFVTCLFDIFERANVDSLIDIVEHKKIIFSLINESTNLDSETKLMLKELILLFLECLKDVSKEELISILNKKKNEVLEKVKNI